MPYSWERGWMKALSVKPHWAWAIFHAGKNIENRTWKTHYRGALLVHASKVLTRADYVDLAEALIDIDVRPPKFSEILTGGIVGQVDLVAMLNKSDSPWFGGPIGWEFKNPQPLPFRAHKGQLSLFEV